LAILPDTTHVTLMQRMAIIVPMVNDFVDAKPQKQASAPVPMKRSRGYAAGTASCTIQTTVLIESLCFNSRNKF
jgi:hypothetical protein